MHPIAPMGRTLILAALLAAPLAAGPAEGDFPIRLTLLDTDPKLLPIVVQPDADPKDVLIKHRVPYGPGNGLGPGLERRTRMRAVRPDGAASEQLLLPVDPYFTGSIRVSVDSTEGLVHGLSLAWLERRPVLGPIEPLRVEAVWNSEIGGLTLRAFVGDEQAGDLLHLPGETEATLRFALSAGGLEVQGGGAGGLTTICTQEQVFIMQEATWSWGCAGLQPKGAFWFAQLRFEWVHSLYSPGSFSTVEGNSLAAAFFAREWVLAAGALLADPAPHDTQQLYENILTAAGVYDLYGIDPALTWLTAAWLQGQFASTTSVPATLLLAQGASKLAHKCLDQAATLAAAGDDGSPLKPRVGTLQRRIELLMARLLGFKSKSHARLLKTVELLTG